MGIFGPSKKEVWAQMAQEVNGEFIDEGFWRGCRVEVKHKNWVMYLDTYTVNTGKSSVTYTRVRAPFVNRDGLLFKIYYRGIFSDIGKFFGMQDIEIGIEEFDKIFIIQGNNEDRIARLFSNFKIRELLCGLPKVMLEVVNKERGFGTKLPENESALSYIVVGVIKDVEQLKSIVELFKSLLDELELLGSAGSGKPTAELYRSRV